MQSLPSALVIASADHVAQAGSLVKTSSSTLVSTRMSVMAAHGIEVVVGAAVGGAPVLARLDQRIEGRLAGRLGATSTRFLHDNVPVDLAEIDGRAGREAMPLSYFERNGDLPFGSYASCHGRFEVLLICSRVILRSACRFNASSRGGASRSRTRPGRSHLRSPG